MYYSQVKTWYDEQRLDLIVTVLSAANLPPRVNGQYRNPYAKVYLLPDRRYNTELTFATKLTLLQTYSKKSQKRTKTVVNSNHPSWNQTFYYSGIRPEDLVTRILEVTVWDYDRFGSNEFLGEVNLDLSTTASHHHDDDPIWHSLSLHENVGGDLTTVPPICHTPGLVIFSSQQ